MVFVGNKSEARSRPGISQIVLKALTLKKLFTKQQGLGLHFLEAALPGLKER